MVRRGCWLSSSSPSEGLMLAVSGAVALAVVAPGLGPAANFMALALLLTSVGLGRLACYALRVPEDPFLGLVIGFTVLSHLLLVVDLFVPGAHWQLAAAAGVASLAGWRGAWARPNARMFGLSLLIAAFYLRLEPRRRGAVPAIPGNGRVRLLG